MKTTYTVYVFEGRIRRSDYRENYDVLMLDDTCLSKAFAEALGNERRQVSVRYFISSEPMTEEERTHAEVMIAIGEGYAEYVERYSFTTGYLWTDEELTVGGHDLETEIGSYVGSWCRLELMIHV